ncbi:MAG: hypothetical protein KGD59_11805 [Candidatus Heimdallarchaeota archaeon]|nr:hypothetical protein [Candidatus Heimdallarchaeota archaeon]MBY8995228.1 hypothetical protein [Candidatus Heimdallarchaeota archaeon]
MIQAIWIITDTGQCIFSHKYIELGIDDQLIAGLLTAFDAFSSESGIGGVQQIGGEDNQFIYGSSQKLLVAALADKRDNADLVEKLMVKISNLFQEKYAPYLKDLAFVDLNVFNGFEEEIDQILKPKVYKRGAGSTFFATFISLALSAGVFMLLLNILDEAVFLVFLAFIPGLFVGALIAGKSTYGLISSIITVLPIIGYYSYTLISTNWGTEAILNSIFDIFLMAVTYITIAMLCGIGGGSIIDRRRLFPLVEETEQLAVIPSQVTVAQPDLRTQLTQQQETYQQETYPQETYQEEEVQVEEQYYDSSSIVEEKKDEWDS